MYPPQSFPEFIQHQPDPNASTRKLVKWICGGAAALFWIVALFLPAYSDGTPGVLCVLFGWSMLLSGNTLAFIAWFGNLPFWIGYFMFIFGKRKAIFLVAILMGSCAFLFSFGALTVSEVAQNEGGSMTDVSPAAATYVWMISGVLLIAGSAINLVKGAK